MSRPGEGSEVLPAPPRPVRALTPTLAVVVASGAWAGALIARPVSLLVPAGALALVAMARRPALLVIPVALAASALGERALAGLAPPPVGPVAGTATLISDPEVRWGTTEAIGRLEGRHVLLRAEGPAGEVLAARSAGERVDVDGRLHPLPARARWLQVRHVAAEVRVRSARPGSEAAPPWRAANHVRQLLDRGAEPLGDERRALYLGLVLGDDRDQSPETVDDFRGSGLAHLLAVSGQNVAFVLGLAAPLLIRLRPGPRLVAAGVVLALFALATRCEPSVLRAVAMAGGALVAAARGRPTAGVQILALAVTGLVLVDPLLVRSLGFQMSVAATGGILVIGPHLVRVLPGPPPLVLAAAVTGAAQLAVAPLQVAGFGGVPVASLPANLLAGPAAAVVMTWGLPAGLAAGVLGPPWDGWLHRPTGLALSGLAGVARLAASVPLGEAGPWHLGVVAAALLVLVGLGAGLGRRAGRSGDPPGVAARAVAVRRDPPEPCSSGPPSVPSVAASSFLDIGDLRAVGVASPGGIGHRVARAVAVLALVGALVAPAVALRRAPPLHRPAAGVTVWRDGPATVVVIEPGTGARVTLESLRRAGVVRVDLLVIGPGRAAADEERAARHRARVGRSWHLGRDPVEGTPPARVGSLQVHRIGAGVCVRRPTDAPCPDPDRAPGAGR